MTFGHIRGVKHRQLRFSAADVITYTYMGVGLLVVTMNIGAVIYAWWRCGDVAPYQSIPSVEDTWLTRVLMIPSSPDMLQKRAGLSIILVCLAGLLDGIDGPIARWRGTAAPRGEDLDGMADTVAFGMAPAATLWATAVLAQVQQKVMSHGADTAGLLPSEAWYPFIWMACGLFVAAMQWRLRASHHTGWTHFVFKGLPAPGSGLAICALAVLWDNALQKSSGPGLESAASDITAMAQNSSLYVYLGVFIPLALAIYMTSPIPAVKMNRAGPFQITLDILMLIAFITVLVLHGNMIMGFTVALGVYVVLGLVFGIMLLRQNRRKLRAAAAAEKT